MGLFTTSPKLDSIHTLLVDQLQDLYDAEQRINSALPKMIEAADSAILKNAFQEHLYETEGQVKRLEQVFKSLGEKVKGKTCAAMKGLLTEGEEVINASGDATVKDAALIALAQRVEHYEMAAYGCARTFARLLGMNEVARLLQETLDEESAIDEKLTWIAEESINFVAPQKRILLPFG